MKDELRQIIKELKEVLDEARIYVTNETMLDAILRIYNTNQINNQKKFKFFNVLDKTKEEIDNEKREEPATEKQINLIRRYKTIIPIGLTKREAMKIISKIKENER
jgi:hypothetical protein